MTLSIKTTSKNEEAGGTDGSTPKKTTPAKSHRSPINGSGSNQNKK